MDESTLRSIYDFPEYYSITSPGCDGDITFYKEEITQIDGPVLEIGFGTGRTLIPLAEAGVKIIGIDNSRRMMTACQAEAQRKEVSVSLLEKDMRSLDFQSEFRAVIMPYRVFLSLHSIEDQLACLSGVHNALEDGGKLIMNIFDPDVATLAEFAKIGSSFRLFREGELPENGKTVVTWASTRLVQELQIVDEIWKYDELDDESRVISTNYGRFKIRYGFRFEMEHLFYRMGFKVESLFGDFDRSPFRQGHEQIWICRKA